MILVTGGTGFLGQHVMAALEHRQWPAVAIGRTACDLRNREAVRALFEAIRPRTVLHLAYPGGDGIHTAVRQPADLVDGVLQMDLNVIAVAADYQCRVITAGSVCAFPSDAPYPTRESDLWRGRPEPVNAPYGLAKRMQGVILAAYGQQHGLTGVQLLLANLYGPGDRSGHVIPATIAKVRQALVTKKPILVWGDPDVTRTFLYVADAAEAFVRAASLEWDGVEDPIIVASHAEVSMEHLVGRVATALNAHETTVVYDRTKPTGDRRRGYVTARLAQRLAWEPPTPFITGLAATIDWTLAQDA